MKPYLRASWPAAAVVTATLLAIFLWPKPAPPACMLPPQAANAPHPGMVWVPAGRFEFGDTVYPEEQPIRSTSVDGFWIDRTEVSNDQFAQFVAATGYVTVAEQPVDTRAHPNLPPAMRQSGAVVFRMPEKIDGRDDLRQWWSYLPGANWRHPGGPDTNIAGHGAYPVVAVTIADARAYAAWKGHMLPSEAQWEWAARGARPQAAPEHEQPKEANTWQGPFPLINTAEDGYLGLAPVACFKPNALGLFDMIGNVWEITADVFVSGHAAPDQMPRMIAGDGVQHVIKGGSYLCAPNYCMRYRAGAREAQDDDLAASHLGFRTILAAPGP
ncbi:MAG: formylglycine-generating enzyme family protein [Pseudomonadota bacterium]